MTVGTDSLVKRRGVILYMTILTNECRAIGFGLMGGKFEGNGIVIKCCRCPILCGVTCSALIAKSSRVRIILFMTVGAVHWRANKDRIDMAAFASNCGVLSIQFERKFRMVDGPVPSICDMT